MKYSTDELQTCVACQVRFAADKAKCPVCMQSVSPSSSPEHHIDDGAPLTDTLEYVLVKAGWKRIFLVCLAIIFAIPGIIVLIIDIAQNKRVDWSIFVWVFLITVWCTVVVSMKWQKRLVLLSIGYVLLLLLLLFSINCIQGVNWFFPIAFPLVTLWAAVVILLIAILKKTKKGFNTIGILFCGIALGVLGTELILAFSLYEHFTLYWSLIVVSPLLFIALLMFYLHKHHVVLERWFHL